MDHVGQPHRIAIVIGPRFPLLSLAICTEMLRVANRESASTAFARTILTSDGGPAMSSSGIEIAADDSVERFGKADVVVVLTSYAPEETCAPNVLAWLRRQDRQGAIMCCADTGALVLARAGVIRDRYFAVHHEPTPAYREAFGDTVLIDRLNANDRGLLSSGGAMATAEMVLEFISACEGAPLAKRVAHVLNAFPMPDRAPSPPEGAIAHMDRRMGRMVELMQSHMDEPLPMERLCQLSGLDTSTGRRLFRKHFGVTPGQYYRGLRLERARRTLYYSALPIGEVAVQAGFADASAFARAYRRHFGQLPSHDRQTREQS